MATKPSVYSFLTTLTKNWFALMSGAMSIPFTYLGLFQVPEKLKSLFIVLAISSLLTALYILWKKERMFVIDLELKLENREKLKNIRIRLADFLNEGLGLMQLCADESNPPPNEDANAWSDRVEEYLGRELDKSYIARYRDGSGLPTGINAIYSTPHRNLWGGIRVRSARLQEFISELTSRA